MLRAVGDLIGYRLQATDGEIGRCADFLCGGADWVVRYLVADTSRWLPGRKVLVSPVFLDAPRWAERRFPVRLTREEIRRSPPLREREPVTRRHERAYFDYYQFPFYWEGSDLWGSYPTPQAFGSAHERPAARDAGRSEAGAGELYSLADLVGFAVLTRDAAVGRVAGFLMDERSWAVPWVAVETRAGTARRPVLAETRRVAGVDPGAEEIRLDLGAEALRGCPVWDPARPPTEEEEARLRRHYREADR
ncbi:MAG: PRC-barrel domain-containing protein [Deferrisomatales bacterium]